MDFIKKNLLVLIAAVLGVLTIIFALFMKQLVIETKGLLGTNTESIKGLKTIFGSDKNNTEFCFMGFVMLLLVVCGIVCSCLKAFKIGPSFILGVVAAAAFAVAALLLFCGTTDMMVTLKTGKISDAKDLPGTTVKLGIGFILGGITSACAAVASALSIFKK